MKKLLRLLSVATMLLAATSFMACSSDDDDDSGARSVSARTSGSIVGVVLDNKGEPVEGATVTLGGKSTKTNYGGEFEITGVNPNDSKLIKAAKTVTTTSTESTKAGTGTGASATPTETSHSTTSTTGDGTVSSDVLAAQGATTPTTGYTLTVKKDGYLSGKVTGIYVTYQDTEDPEVTRANALLHGLQFDYQDILDKYAAALTNANANNGGAVGTTATTTTTATEDTTATTTVQTGSNADRVFKDISEAISSLKNLYKTGSYTEYFSTFGTTTTPLIPLDASLKGKIKLNLKTRTGTTYDEKTYTPKSNPTVHVSYNSGTYNVTTNSTTTPTKVVDGSDYTWEAKVDSDGNFVFDKCLPSGVPLSITVDSFEEKITKEGATEAEAYWFSSASQVIYAEGTDTSVITKTINSETNASTTTTTSSEVNVSSITLGSKDANEKSYLIMLYAQNDKVWVTKTNVEPTANGSLLTKKDALTFTFNKAMKKVGATAAGITNLAKDAYTATLSEDKKTVTFTPNIGYWILSGDYQTVTLTVEAEDGATTLLKNDFTVYFDNKVWVSVKDLSYDDYNDLRALSDPITLVFSKPMNEKIAVNLDNNNTAYTEKWNEDFTELTLTPDAKVGYWDLGSKTTIVIKIADAYANSKDSYINNFGFWKVGAAEDGKSATVHFDNYNDVTIAKAETGAGFTVTFDKPIKAQTESELKENLNVYKAGTAYAVEDTQDDAAAGKGLADVVLALSEDGKTITVTPQNTEFANYGYYSLVFAKDKFVAKTGEKILRKPATTKYVQTYANSKTTTPFVTTFTLGTEFKYTAVTVVDKLPETALASRAIYVDNDKYLKITFNKAVRKSELQINKVVLTTPTTNPTFEDVTNYIDGKDVYLPLAARADNVDVVVKGTVTAKDGQTWDLGSAATGFNTLYKVNKLSYQMVATSLYTVKKAIAEGAASTSNGNDALINKIAPADTTITFTFDQKVEDATWSAEFYDELNVGKKNLDQTPYVATAVASGKVVTVTLSGKERDFDAHYYLSLKATKGTGDDVVVLYDSSATTTTGSYGPLPGRASTSNDTLDSQVLTTATANSKKYIKVNTKTEKEVSGLDNLYVVDSSNNKASDTTLFKEFEKTNNSPIKLEFSESVEGFTAVLANGLNYNANSTTASADNWLTKDDVDNTKTYESTYALDDTKKVLTITPTYAFASGAVVYPVVFDKDGKRFPLKNAKDVDFLSTTDTTKQYKAATQSFTTPTAGTTEKAKAKDAITNKLLDETKSTKLVLTNFDAKNVGNGSAIYFSFTPIASTRKTSVDYGTYTLYRKITGINTASTVWEKVGDYSIGSGLQSVDTSKAETVAEGETDTARVKSVESVTNADPFAIGRLAACIKAETAENEFNFAEKSTYKLVLKLDNDEIHSAPIEVTDVKLNAKLTKADGSTITTSTVKNDTLTVALGSDTEVAWAENELKFDAPCYLKGDVTVELKSGNVNAEATTKDNRIGSKGSAKATVTYDGARKVATIKITGKDGTSQPVAAKGDEIIIKGTDASGITRTFTIAFQK